MLSFWAIITCKCTGIKLVSFQYLIIVAMFAPNILKMMIRSPKSLHAVLQRLN